MDEARAAPQNLDPAAPTRRAGKPLPTSRLKMSHLRMIVALEEH